MFSLAFNTSFDRKHVPYHMACFHLPEVLRLQEKWKGCTTDDEKTRCIQEQADTLKERKIVGHTAVKREGIRSSGRIQPLNALRLWKAAQLDGRAAELEAIRQARVQRYAVHAQRSACLTEFVEVSWNGSGKRAGKTN